MPGVLPNNVSGRLNRVQSFQETTWGTWTTANLATARWMGINPTPKFTPIFKSETFDENRGGFAPSYVSYVPELGGAFNINWDATFEDIMYSLFGIFGPVVPTGGGPYTYSMVSALTTAFAPQSYSLELDYDIATLVAKGCLTNKLQIKFNAKNKWTLAQSGFFQRLDQHVAINIASSTNASPIAVTTSAPHGLATGNSVVIAGHLVNTAANGTWTIIVTGASAFTLTGSTGNGIGAATGTVTQGPTPGISDRVVEPLLFAGETTLAIDNAAGTPGTTPAPNVLVSGSLDIENSLQPFYTGDQKYPVDWTEDKWKVELNLRLKWNAQIKALYDTQWTVGNRNIFQIKSTSGAKSCEIDFAGILTSDPSNYDLDYGAQTIDLKWGGQYDTGTLANYLKVILINNVAALP